MTRPGPSKKSPRLSTEGLLQLVQRAVLQLRTVSREGQVQQEALNVGRAVGRLLAAIRASRGPGAGQDPPGPGKGP